MFRNALIGIDEIDGGRDPVRLARKLCAPDARLTLARVHGAFPLLGPALTSSLREAEMRTAEATLHRASRLTGVTDTVSFGAASVGDGLGRLVVEHRNDLLAIGSGHRGQRGIVEVNEWLAQLLLRASCGVAIAPLGYADNADPLKTVGVAYDDSEESRHALVVARRVASDSGSRLVVFESTRGEHHRSQSAEVTRELADFSEGVDLLVLGPRGAGPLRRLTHPSTTLELVHCSQAPLLLVTHLTRTPLGDELPPVEEWTREPSSRTEGPVQS